MPLYNFYVGVNGFYEGLVAIMIQVIENYLKKHEITVADVAEADVISESTLRAVFSQLVEEWTIKVLNGLALTAFSDPGEVLAELQPWPVRYVSDREKQTIQFFHISNQ